MLIENHTNTTIIPANYKIAKSTLSTGIRAYLLNHDVKQLYYWVDITDKYLEPYNHTAFISNTDEGGLVVFAGSKDDEDPWFSVELNIQFPEEESLKTVKG